MSDRSPSPAAMPRSAFLDVLRGVALLGILPVNIAYMAMPVLGAEDLERSASGADRIALVVREAFFTFRFVTLFSFLFGVGIALIAAKCARLGVSERVVLARRFIALLAFGVLHVVLLWYGDILITYALLGLVIIVVGIHRWSERALVVTASLTFLAPLGLLALLVSIPGAADPTFLPEIGELDASEARAIVHAEWNPLDEVWWELHPTFEQVVVDEGSLAQVLFLRLVTWVFAAIVTMTLLAPRALAMMCLGLLAARGGALLDPTVRRRWTPRLIAIGASVGVPLQLISTLLQRGEVDGQDVGIALCLQWVASGGMSAAYLGIVAWFVDRPRDRGGEAGALLPAALRPLAALGRTAFTQYLMQSFLAALIFQSWGFGMFGELGLAELWGVVAGIWIFGLVTSSLWLAKFEQGPLEAFWRWLTYPRAAPATNTR